MFMVIFYLLPFNDLFVLLLSVNLGFQVGKEVIVYRGGGLKVDVRSNGLSKECIQNLQDQLLLIDKRKALANHINRSEEETVVKDYRYEGNSIVMPRYFAKMLRKILILHGYTPVLRDYTSSVPVRWPKLRSKYKLRNPQQKAVDSFDNKGGVCSAITGCHEKGHPILMYDGSVKAVEDVELGDQVMGTDSKPRKVLRLIRGESDMYRVNPRSGDPFVVNEDHILSLECTSSKKKNMSPSDRYGGEIENVSVKEYLTKSKYWKHLRKLYSRPVDFTESNLILDPYFLGLLLGDGFIKAGVQVTTIDTEIIRALQLIADREGVDLRISEKSNNTKAVGCNLKTDRGQENPVITKLRSLNLYGVTGEGKFIPEQYLSSSREQRLELIAGLLDTDGSHNGRGGFDFISKTEALSSGITYLCRSVGLRANISESYKYCQTGKGGIYHRVSISGDTEIIPCRIARKKAPPRKQKKSPLRTGFTVDYAGFDSYYGFTLDADHLYLDGNFVAHHNSGKCLIGLYLASILGQKTLVIINTLGVIKSWVDDAAKFFGIPKKSIGIIQANNASIGSLLTIASVQTMATRDLKNLKDQFGFVLVDECHHQSASTFIDAILKINAKYRLGLSATPRREDGLDAMIFRHLGPLYYRTQDTEGTVPVEFAIKGYQIDYDEGDYDFFRYHDFCEAAMHDVERNEIICDLVMKGVEKGNKVLCTSVRKDHVILLRKMLRAKGLNRSVALLGHGKYSVDEVVDGFLDDKLDAVVATTKIILEGVNCPPWDLLIIGLPFKSGVQVEQLVGRIRRSYKDKEKAMIVDIIDTNIGSIKRQGMSRVGMYYHLGFRKVKLKNEIVRIK